MKRIDSLVRSFLVGAGILLLAGFAVPSVSQAATASFELTSDHCGTPEGDPGCIATAGASAGTITLTDLGGGSIQIHVALNTGFQFVHTGFDSDIGFNLAGSPNPTITYSSVTTGFAATGGSPQSAGSLHMDGTGFFEYGLTCTACGNGGSNPQSGPLNATITASGLTLSSFEKNALGQYFAVDVLGNGQTGAVDASVASTPEPSTVVLYGLGLTMLIVGQKWRKSREISANLN